jgi:hypothetical protein
MASAVRKTTKTAPRAAVTQALLTPATISSAALARVSEVEEEAVEESAAPPPPPTLVHPFTYKLQWRAMLDARTELYTMFYSLQSNVPDSGIEKIDEWFQMFKDDLQNYGIVRTTVAAAHTALAPKDRPSTSYSPDNYRMMLRELDDYQRQEKRVPTIHMTSQCRLFDMQAAMDAVEAIGAPQARTPRASQATQIATPRSTPRVTATTRQHDAIPEERRAMHSGGNFSSTITER